MLKRSVEGVDRHGIVRGDFIEDSYPV